LATATNACFNCFASLAACPPQLLLDLGRLLDYRHVCGQQSGGSITRQHSGVMDSASSDISCAAAPGEGLEGDAWGLAEGAGSVLQGSPEGAGASAAGGGSCTTDDSAYMQDIERSTHPWLSQRWAGHVQRTAQRLLVAACGRGLARTARWLLELLEAQGCQLADVVQVGGGHCFCY
jgi:hypothetical protein